MRTLFLVALVFIVAAPAFAEVQTADTSVLEYAAGTTSLLCRDYWGCPSCQADMSGTMSICVRIHYSSGWCQCASPKAVVNGQPSCGTLKGSCRFIWQ